jgi:hypothetical protein
MSSIFEVKFQISIKHCHCCWPFQLRLLLISFKFEQVMWQMLNRKGRKNQNDLVYSKTFFMKMIMYKSSSVILLCTFVVHDHFSMYGACQYVNPAWLRVAE